MVAGLVVFAASYLIFRKKSNVGSLRMWTVILEVSLILAPLIGDRDSHRHLVPLHALSACSR
ncbi:MAG: hypothetical protein KGI38_06635 [Thaumarchaeota archaeon]|nr:hypothetical protein [Nitrososphaerota archaeon]